jgi:hypothetical protein
MYDIGDTTRTMNAFFHIGTQQEPEEEESDVESIEEVVSDHVESDGSQVRVVNVNLSYNEDDVNTDDESSISDFDKDVELDDVVIADVSMSGEETIHVNKLDETMHSVEEDDRGAIVAEDSAHQIPYQKMNLTQLRAYAVSRGLLSDSGKMKKGELIKLLESNDE